MTDGDHPTKSAGPRAPGEPRRSRLRQLLDERPEARPRIGRAVAALLGTGSPDGSVVLLDQPRHLQLVQAEEQPAASLAGRRETDRKAASG